MLTYYDGIKSIFTPVTAAAIFHVDIFCMHVRLFTILVYESAARCCVGHFLTYSVHNYIWSLLIRTVNLKVDS